jgi:hypothetical protein
LREKQSRRKSYSIGRGNSFSEICENLCLSVAITENKNAGLKTFGCGAAALGNPRLNSLDAIS